MAEGILAEEVDSRFDEVHNDYVYTNAWVTMKQRPRFGAVVS
uniref:Uncharacterized protein n=1 Tax=Candidatus Kentrum sp. LPFa TaxID=2126335 RepID=A0A450VSK8_9GAMM|nr:MAG: hypothetical protein BECKLPF1236A_GA0070988_1001112 [Candidatus Kentron sp. LPFa]VFK28685.1 MAG: hypothetical protein BECKLPF1236C_GA0070990_1007111 [Candidatus Kentron sp. LPFa]